MNFDIESVKRLLAAATPGPWMEDTRYPGKVYCDDKLGTIVADCGTLPYRLRTKDEAESNSNLIAAAPTLLRAACERIEKLERVVEAARDMVNLFIHKVETGQARSKKTYADALAVRDALAALDAGEVE